MDGVDDDEFPSLSERAFFRTGNMRKSRLEVRDYVSISFRESLLSDNLFKGGEAPPRRGRFPSLSERAFFRTEMMVRKFLLTRLQVSISFRESLLSDKGIVPQVKLS